MLGALKNESAKPTACSHFKIIMHMKLSVIGETQGSHGQPLHCICRKISSTSRLDVNSEVYQNPVRLSDAWCSCIKDVR